MGFTIAQREELPDKIYKDCMNCPKLHACDEVAMVRGELPQYSILAQPAKQLVKIRA
jgi:amino-acid N-acetyltransferase